MSNETNDPQAPQGDGDFTVRKSLEDANPVDFIQSVNGFAHHVLTNDDAWAAAFKSLTDEHPMPAGLSETELRMSLHAQADIVGSLMERAAAVDMNALRDRARREMGFGPSDEGGDDSGTGMYL